MSSKARSTPAKRRSNMQARWLTPDNVPFYKRIGQHGTTQAHVDGMKATRDAGTLPDVLIPRRSPSLQEAQEDRMRIFLDQQEAVRTRKQKQAALASR